MKYEDYIAKVEAGEIPVETHGHVSYTFEPREIRSALMFERLVGHPTEGNPQMEFPWVKEGNCLGTCCICGEEPSITFYEDRIEVEDNHSDFGPFSVDIKFPTGVMLFADDLREGYSADDYDVNTTVGIQRCSEDYAGQGMMHFFVGNSCPAVWREGDTIYVGSLSEADDHKRIGSICTDLWWASFVDPQSLASKLLSSSLFKQFKTYSESVEQVEKHIKAVKRDSGMVEVTPGTYRCTSYFHVGDLDYAEEKTQVYCKLEPLSGISAEPS